MSGTGQFRGTWSPRGTSDTAREHLGDRMAAFVDGELGDDARERVLSHLTGCDQCRAEAEEQRRLKNAVAAAQPPAVSAGLLARLQQLPGCDPDDPGGPGACSGGLPGRRAPDPGADDPDGPSAGSLFGAHPVPQPAVLSGFPVHDFGRAPSRGRRFAFAAAGAFSLAALALGAGLPLDGSGDGSGVSDPVPGNAATPISWHPAGEAGPSAAAPPPAGEDGPMLAPHAARAAPPSHPAAPSPTASPSARPARPTAGPSALPSAPWRSAPPASVLSGPVALAAHPMLGGPPDSALPSAYLRGAGR